MHRAARGGDSKAVIFFNIWERFVGAKLVESHMEALIADSHPETFAFGI